MRQNTGTVTVERAHLEKLFFELQRERIALTCAIMKLREESPVRRPRIVMSIMIALLRLERANRSAAAALGLAKPS